MMLLLRVSWGGDQAWSSCRKPRPCTNTGESNTDKYGVYIYYLYIYRLLFIYIYTYIYIYEHANPIRPDFQPGSTNFSFSISHLSVSWRLTGFNFIWGELRILYCFFLVWCGPKGISLDEGTNLALIAICASYERCRPMIFMKMYLFSWYICPAERDSFSRTVPKSAPCFPDIMCVCFLPLKPNITQ